MVSVLSLLFAVPVVAVFVVVVVAICWSCCLWFNYRFCSTYLFVRFFFAFSLFRFLYSFFLSKHLWSGLVSSLALRRLRASGPHCTVLCCCNNSFEVGGALLDLVDG